MMRLNSSIVYVPIEWERTGDAFYPYRAVKDGNVLRLRVGDFPEEYVYTLISGTDEIVEFDIWPDAWTRYSKDVD